MPKPRLNEDQYLSEQNRQLLQHEQFRERMAFIPYPEGSSGCGMSGYSVTGPFELMGVFAQVANQVKQQFDLDV